MTDVGRYRDGTRSSTELMQNAMETAHAVDPGEGKTLEWHRDHESMDQARARMHDQPAKTTERIVEWAAKKIVTGDAIKVAKGVVESKFPEYAAAAKNMAHATAAVAVAASEPLAGVTLAVAAVAVPVNAILKGDELKHRSQIDALDVATTSVLDLDPGFKAQQYAKHPSISPESTTRLFIDTYNRPTAYGKEHLPELQAAADAGATSALLAMKMGGKEEYFAQNPAAKARYNDDVAFSKGFDNAIYIASHDHAEEKLKALEAKLAERNAWLSTSRPVQG